MFVTDKVLFFSPEKIALDTIMWSISVPSKEKKDFYSGEIYVFHFQY